MSLNIIYLFFFKTKFCCLKAKKCLVEEKVYEICVLCHQIKKSIWSFCQTQLWCGLLCCFWFYFRLQYNPHSLAQMSGNGILWSMWISHGALTGKEEFEQQLNVLTLSILCSLIVSIFSTSFFSKDCRSHSCLYTWTICVDAQIYGKLAKFERRCGGYLTLLHGYVFLPKELSSHQYPSKTKQACEQCSNAFTAAEENGYPQANKPLKIVTHLTSQLEEGATSFTPNFDPWAKKNVLFL